MGVANLWQELVQYANVCRSWSGAARTAGNGESRDDNAEIVAELCGKVLAIDTSVWLFQCSQQSDLKEVIYDEQARVLYIVIYRIMNLLRYGVTPLFVLEGDTPEAKMGRLNQRSLAKGMSGRAVGNRRGGRHDALGRKVVELLDLMGVPHVDAPGEAEAMCAALTTVGLAHAAVTSDVDALLFGARRVYRECRVQMDAVKNNVLERVDAAEAARRCFGLLNEGAGCVRALQAVACLSGCDYSVSGGKGVGVKTALDAVQQLTVGRQDDSQVLPELLRYLETGPDPRVTALTKCTGCKTCGHEKHSRQPCALCGPGPCRPKGNGAPCECEFHRSEPQRKFMRVIARAATTGPSFSSEVRATISAFDQETQRARQAAEALRQRVGTISWSRRPDVNGVFQLMHPLLGHTSADPNKLLWTYPEVRDKLRAVLMEWDMRQGPEPSAPARALVEFRPRRIKQVAAKDGGLWAYLMEFDRIPTVNPADAEFDSQQLSNSKLVKARHVRCTLVNRLWPHLLQLREEEEQAKLAKPKRGRGKAAAGGAASGSSPGGISGPSGAAAGPSGRAGGSRAGAAAGGVTRSGPSQGSSDVMLRFLRMGGAAPTTSVQQPPPRQPFAAQVEADPAGPSGRAAHAAHGGALARGPSFEEVDDRMEDEFQMTQRNDGSAGGATGGAAAAAAAGARAGTGEEPTRQAAGPSPADGVLGARPRLTAGMVALWGDAGHDSDDDGGGRSNSGCGERRPMYDDLDDVIPSSLEELLASASQRGGGRAMGRRGPPPPPPPPARNPGRTRVGAAAAAHRGGSADDATDAGDEAYGWGGAAAPGRTDERIARPQRQGSKAAAAAAGPADEGPFQPQPTGPGPGTERAAAAGGIVGRGGEAVGPHLPRNPQSACRAGGNPAAAATVEVLDLTDSPAFAVPVARIRTAAAAHAAAATTAAPGRDDPGAGGSGENYIGPAVLLRGTGAHRQEQHDHQQVQDQGGEEEAIGSAVKPARKATAVASVATAGGGEDGQVSARVDQPRSDLLLQQEPQDEGQAQRASQRDAALGDPGTEDAAEESPAARRTRLMRTLFPDAPEGRPPAESRSRRAETGPAAAPAQPRRQPQPPEQRDGRVDEGCEGSPSKRRNTGDGGVSGGVGRGGELPSGTESGRAAHAGARVAAEHVDLTLDDDEDEGGVVDLT